MTHCHWQRFECISVLLWISSDAIRSHWPGGAMCHWLSSHSMQPSQKQESFNAIAHLLVHCFAFVTLWYLVSISQFATCWCCRYNAMSNIYLMQKRGRNHLWRILSGTKVQNWQPFCSDKEDGGVRRPWRLWPLASGGNGPELYPQCSLSMTVRVVMQNKQVDIPVHVMVVTSRDINSETSFFFRAAFEQRLGCLLPSSPSSSLFSHTCRLPPPWGCLMPGTGKPGDL